MFGSVYFLSWVLIDVNFAIGVGPLFIHAPLLFGEELCSVTLHRPLGTRIFFPSDILFSSEGRVNTCTQRTYLSHARLLVLLSRRGIERISTSRKDRPILCLIVNVLPL